MLTPTILALDGALGPFSVALLHASQTITRTGAGNDALERGLTLIDEVCEASAVAVGEVDAIAVGVGPGGFTGLRITLAFAKALAAALERPLIPVSSFDVVARSVATVRSGNVLVEVVRPRTKVYCARIRSGAHVTTAGGTLEQLRDALASYTAIDLAAIPNSAAAEIIDAGVAAHATDVADIPAAFQIAHEASRLIESIGLAAFASSHGVAADYGEAPLTTMPAGAA